MASNGVDSTTGYPKFPEEDAPQLGSDLEEVAAFAADVGTRIVRANLAGLNAYAYKRAGLSGHALDTGLDYVHDGSAWRLVGGIDTGYVPLTNLGSGWNPTTGYEPWIRRIGNRVDIGGAVTRTTTLGALATIVEVPVGFRITSATYLRNFISTAVASTKQAVTLFYLSDVSHYLQVNSTYITGPPLGASATVPLMGSWFVD